MQRTSYNFGGFLRSLSSLLVIGVAWWLLGEFKIMNPLFFPRLTNLTRALFDMLTRGEIYLDVVATGYRAASGLMLSALVAVPLGLIFGRRKGLYEFFEFPVDFLRSIPSSALFFLFILFFGIGDASKVAVVFYGCSLILLVNTIYGARPTKDKQDRINMLISFGATKRQVFTLAIFRDALPHIAAGLRICVSLSLVLVVVTEMFLSADRGLGRRIYDYYLAYRVAEMYAVIVVLGVLGFAANKVSSRLERRASFWLPAQT